MIIMGQYQMLIMMNQRAEKVQIESKRLDDQHVNEDLFKATVEKLLVQEGKVLGDLEATVDQLSAEMEKKKVENDSCQAEKVRSFSYFFSCYSFTHRHVCNAT